MAKKINPTTQNYQCDYDHPDLGLIKSNAELCLDERRGHVTLTVFGADETYVREMRYLIISDQMYIVIRRVDVMAPTITMSDNHNEAISAFVSGLPGDQSYSGIPTNEPMLGFAPRIAYAVAQAIVGH